MKDRLINWLIILVALAALLYLVPLPRSVDTTLTGLRWSDGDTTAIEPAEVKVEGVMLRYLFRRDSFRGSISFTGLDAERYTLAHTLQLKDGQAQLIYYDKAGNTMVPFGTLYIRGAFREVVIQLSEGEGWNFITAPAAERSEAVNLTENLLSASWSEDFDFE